VGFFGFRENYSLVSPVYKTCRSTERAKGENSSNLFTRHISSLYREKLVIILLIMKQEMLHLHVNC